MPFLCVRNIVHKIYFYSHKTYNYKKFQNGLFRNEYKYKTIHLKALSRSIKGKVLVYAKIHPAVV